VVDGQDSTAQLFRPASENQAGDWIKPAPS